MTRTVSIIINNYNYALYLRQAIDSALAQTHPQTEVIVVDDGSSDNSREIIDSYGDVLKPVYKENGGQGSAFNAGYARSTGEVVTFLDADDYLVPTAFERILSSWNDSTDILHHRLSVFDHTGSIVGYYPPLPDRIDSDNALDLLLRNGNYSGPSTSGLVYSRRILEKVLPMPEEIWRICADAYLCMMTPFYGNVTAFDESVAYYRLHGKNSFGLPHQAKRKTLTLNSLQLTTMLTRKRFSLIREMAARNGLKVANFPLAGILFGELLVHRACHKALGLLDGARIYQRLIVCLWSEENLKWRFRVQKSIMGFIIWLSPRPVLRFIYPRVFCK